MGKGLDKFKDWVNQSTEKINESSKKIEKKVKNEVKFFQKQGSLNEAFEQASYQYEIVGTTNWMNKPKRIKGFLVEDDLKILIKIEEENHELIVKNVLLKDVKDESIIQIDEVHRDEMVYLDLKVDDQVMPVGCFYATYKAQDIPNNRKNVVKVEDDKIVGTVHFQVK
ncbi:MAG: hypothetical protein AB7E61_05120 [Acholeplasmataceae bacterium]